MRFDVESHYKHVFVQEPDVNFDVESHFEGRPLPQVAALIVNQVSDTFPLPQCR